MTKYNPEFAQQILKELPLGTETERALAVAEMYGRKPEMETALQEWKAQRGIFQRNETLIDVLHKVCSARLNSNSFGDLDREAVCGADGKYLTKSQQGWEQYFAGSGKRLPTLTEYITALKKIEQTNSSMLEGIKQDLRENSLCTGTKIDYRTSNLPVGNGYLDVLVKDTAWRTALQDLLQHDVKETIDLLQRTSRKRPYIWTLDASGRKSHPERAVWLGIDTGRFYLDCINDPFNSSGRARGCVRRARKRTAKKW